jgi:hypothetical protein
MANQAFQPWEDEKPDLIEEAKAVLGTAAKEWLDAPNYQLGGETPRELIESNNATKQQFVRDLLRAIKYGMTT